MGAAARLYANLPANERQELRLPSLLKTHLVQMAERLGESVTQYVIEAVAERVSNDLASATTWELTVPEQQRLLELLAKPPAPTRAFLEATRRADELFGPAEPTPR